VGLFQQRPSQDWGTVDQITDPYYSAGKFLDGLKQVPDWDKLPTTVAAQTVQRSAFPDAYAKWESKANDLAKAVTPGAQNK
jgi:peptidoglycan DL-endopeptidase CwlO